MEFYNRLAYDPHDPLLFCSGTFLLLFTVFITFWSLLRGTRSLRLNWLLAFSYYYCYRCNGRYVGVLMVLSVVDWAGALCLHATKNEAWRRTWLSAAIALNLLALAGFKYTNFFRQGLSLALTADYQPLAVFLPIGLSFHVFQSMSYLVDVYRRRLEPTRSLRDYALFLAFFPQIVAGPIVRAAEFLPQLKGSLTPTREDIDFGLYRVMLGVIKKAVIADYLGGYVDLVFAAPGAYSGVEVLLGVYAYAVQIYLDFAGYSDMAIGLGRLMGMRLPENFEAPYAATSFSGFWRRWHQTLSSWLRDYLYIPLGGNRRGSARRYLNLVLTMFLGGLWHGPSLTFVAWGGLHGIALVIEKVAFGYWGPKRSGIGRALGWLVTFHGIAALWVLFRAPTFSTAGHLFSQLVVGWDLERVLTTLEVRRLLLLSVAVGLGGSLLPVSWVRGLQMRFRGSPWPIQAAMLVLIAVAVHHVSRTQVQPFIYFQF